MSQKAPNFDQQTSREHCEKILKSLPEGVSWHKYNVKHGVIDKMDKSVKLRGYIDHVDKRLSHLDPQADEQEYHSDEE